MMSDVNSHGVSALAIVAIGFAAGCSGGSTTSPAVDASASASVSAAVSVPVVNAVADTNVKIALRNFANCEEAYYTDGNAYGTVAQVTASCPKIQLPAGTVISVHLNTSTGFCLAGRVSATRYWIYDSTNGGVAEQPASSDTCDTGTFREAGGTIRG